MFFSLVLLERSLYTLMGARDGENTVDVVAVVVVAFTAAVYTVAAAALSLTTASTENPNEFGCAQNALVPVFHCCFAILIATTQRS